MDMLVDQDDFDLEVQVIPLVDILDPGEPVRAHPTKGNSCGICFTFTCRNH